MIAIAIVIAAALIAGAYYAAHKYDPTKTQEVINEAKTVVKAEVDKTLSN